MFVVFVVEVHDSNPNDSYTCKDYEEYDRCPIDGNSYIEFGQTANTACCVCGMYMYLNSISQKIILENLTIFHEH